MKKTLISILIISTLLIFNSCQKNNDMQDLACTKLTSPTNLIIKNERLEKEDENFYTLRFDLAWDFVNDAKEYIIYTNYNENDFTNFNKYIKQSSTYNPGIEIYIDIAKNEINNINKIAFTLRASPENLEQGLDENNIDCISDFSEAVISNVNLKNIDSNQKLIYQRSAHGKDIKILTNESAKTVNLIYSDENIKNIVLQINDSNIYNPEFVYEYTSDFRNEDYLILNEISYESNRDIIVDLKTMQVLPISLSKVFIVTSVLTNNASESSKYIFSANTSRITELGLNLDYINNVTSKCEMLGKDTDKQISNIGLNSDNDLIIDYELSNNQIFNDRISIYDINNYCISKKMDKPNFENSFTTYFKGYIQSATQKDSSNYLEIDDVKFLGGEDAITSAIINDDCTLEYGSKEDSLKDLKNLDPDFFDLGYGKFGICAPNGYYIENNDTTTKNYELDNNAKISVNIFNEKDREIEPAEITTDDFINKFEENKTKLFGFKLQNGKIIEILETYLP